MLKKYDLTIVGGGLVGATLALGLATLAQRQGGYQPSIAVIESQPVQLAPQGKEPPLTADARSTALAYGSRLLLEDLGLWDSLAEQATPIKQIHISRQGHWGASRIDCQTMDRPALGYVIPNQHLKSALWSRLVDHPTIALIAPAEILNLLPVSGGFQLTLAEQPSIQTSLLAIADGSQSASCARLGIKQQRHPYQQQAIIANLSIAKPHENQAFERFLATGPLALLPVQGDRCGLVWTLNDREVGAIAALTDKAFLDHLQRVFGYRLGQLSELSARCQFSLSLVQATEQVRPHLVVLGNAAHTLHPVAGQGFNLALRGVGQLLALLIQDELSQQAFKDFSRLQQFAQLHQQDQRQLVRFTDGMIRVNQQQSSILQHLFSLGLTGLDSIPSLKRQLTLTTMGLGPALKRFF